MNPKELIQLVNRHPSLRSALVGKIKVAADHTLFELDASYEAELLKQLRLARFKGNPVRIKRVT
ncbi:DbpA RNA binding domain-containing protein [Candidatus Peregrinibacteria bacterium]|nr:MAG: DbpA RNA binding domain-containing protein [Candidatus Peregrinibacteria bacterium]